MDSALAHIRNLTGELHLVQRELEEAAKGGASSVHIGLLDEEETITLLADFKVTVDNMRRFLWAYLEAISVHDQSMTEALQTARLMRVTELLRVLHDTEGGAPNATRGISEMVDAVLAHTR
jgi:hypothetical protein